MKKITLTTLCMLSIGSFAQELNKQSLDNLFLTLNQEKIGAGSVSIFQNGKEIYVNSYGKRDYENNLANTSETKFRIGSISKTFTATLILKLIEEKKLSLDTKLSKFYPIVVNADKITIKNLLQHSSGIHNITNNPDYKLWLSKHHSKQQLLEKIYQLTSDFEPNSQEAYSNSNYILLSFIVEDISKKPYKDVLEQFIVHPLHLKNTKIGETIVVNKNEAKSYEYLNNQYIVQPETSMSIPLGAGFIVSTPTDLNTFMYALLNGKILKSSTVKLMKEIKNEAGLGLFRDQIGTVQGFGHSGAIDAFTSYSFCFDETEFCYSFIHNTNEYSIAKEKENLYNATHNKVISQPTKVIAETVTTDILQKYTNEYTSEDIPLVIKFFIENNSLMAQANGQPSFALTAKSITSFEFSPAKIKIDFDENGSKMTLNQNGKIYNYLKK